jgi:hypothetical protein
MYFDVVTTLHSHTSKSTGKGLTGSDPPPQKPPQNTNKQNKTKQNKDNNNLSGLSDYTRTLPLYFQQLLSSQF